jgi:hypothetical protein
LAKIEVLAPDFEGDRIGGTITMAPRTRIVADGSPKVLTLIENGKPNAKTLLGFVADGLRARLPDVVVEVHSKPSAGKAIDADEAEMMAARSRMVITGIGD